MISSLEKEMIDFYRSSYAGNLRGGHGEFASTDKFLEPWTEAKKNLLALFDNQLILRKPINHIKSNDEIVREVYNDYGDENSIIRRYFREFHEKVYEYCRTNKEFCDYVLEKGLWRSYTRKHLIEDVLIDLLIHPNTIAHQKWIYKSKTVELLNPATQKIVKIEFKQNESRPMRLFQRVGEIIGMDKSLFEKFRIQCSQYFNTAKIEGELCLSIHPLDYITMSENSLGWQSCMNWRSRGCYRRGTVEMMNSPMVVVGYFHNPRKPFRFGGDDAFSQPYAWNNKRWRCLFVINDDIICSIKSYPYDSEELEKECIYWLRDLARAHGKTQYTDTIGTFRPWEDEDPIYVETNCNSMYNDFGCTDSGEHYGVWRKDARKIEFNYSGYSECVWCGEYEECDVNGYSEELFRLRQEELLCSNCNAYIGFCAECGDYVLWEEAVEDEYGDIYHAGRCWDNAHPTCPITGKTMNLRYHHSGITKISIASHTNGDIISAPIFVIDGCWDDNPEQWSEYFTAPCPHTSCRGWHSSLIIYDNELAEKGKMLYEKVRF